MDFYDFNRMENYIPQGMNMRWEEPDRMQDRPVFAMARVISQPDITQTYDPNTALKQGTLFPELDKPFTGKRGVI